jgi:hypothetical protein
MADRTTGTAAMAYNQDQFSRACDRIDAATKNDDNETFYAAMICVFTYRMSLEGCDHARETIVQHFIESLPDMLRNANREAARRARSREGNHPLADRTNH